MNKVKHVKPEDFISRLREIAERYAGDEEVIHAKMDDVLCDVLEAAGYSEGVQYFKNTHKWYA